MKQLIVLFSVLISSVLSTQAQSPEAKGLEIATKALEVDEGWGSLTSASTMILKNQHGQESSREMRGKSFEQKIDGDKSMIIFDSPRDVKGTTMLTYTHKVGADDQWLYLPAIQRVKRIASSNKSGPFAGSEFAYEDLSSQEVEKYTYKYIKDETMNGANCFLVERYPVDVKSGYKKQIVWINKDNYRTEKIEFYDRKNSLLKTLEFVGYKQYKGKYWRADEFFMRNHITKKETRIKFRDYNFDANLSNSEFSQTKLKSVR